MSLLKNTPPRPHWSDQQVKEEVAREFIDKIQEWADLYGISEETAQTFLAIVALALCESDDAYQAARYMDDHLNWPVTMELVRILDQAYARMPTLVKRFEIEWVMSNGIRFPANAGQHISFNIGDAELQGEVIEVIGTEAYGVVQLKGNGKLLTVEAEEVKKVFETKQPPQKPYSPESA